MNVNRWLLASLAVLIVIAVLEVLFNSFVLMGIYEQTASVWRPFHEIERMTWAFWLGYLVFAPFFALIYIKGYEPGKTGFGQGLRYGLYMGVALTVMQNLVWYAVLPIPGELSFYWFLGGMIEAITAGAAVGLIYKN
ncbi:MAG: hypothetical protein OEM48_07960 [Gammaproteobacteria bacterium]|nr:hypothetical protein [Gammaproteobacteria bacterium]MDH3370094.1 hypothetical protein [Gammaproteobacteria bacterium]MDH3406847.1 hypothetical protein [Gammaproteobacteria bacterium]MDH5486027.1 hypothetical protein [Gammaproteobacteria bacterium]